MGDLGSKAGAALSPKKWTKDGGWSGGQPAGSGGGDGGGGGMGGLPPLNPTKLIGGLMKPPGMGGGGGGK